MKFEHTNLKVKSSWKIGIVTSRFNEDITLKLLDGALSTFSQLGVKPKQIKSVQVPGAIEIPVTAQALLKKGCHAVVTLGAVIRGETTHYEYVCNSVERGCTQLALDFGRPVVCGVLTTENEDQALARVGGAHGHKGKEAAEVAIEMLNTLETLRRSN